MSDLTKNKRNQKFNKKNSIINKNNQRNSNLNIFAPLIKISIAKAEDDEVSNININKKSNYESIDKSPENNIAKKKIEMSTKNLTPSYTPSLETEKKKKQILKCSKKNIKIKIKIKI